MRELVAEFFGRKDLSSDSKAKIAYHNVKEFYAI